MSEYHFVISGYDIDAHCEDCCVCYRSVSAATIESWGKWKLSEVTRSYSENIPMEGLLYAAGLSRFVQPEFSCWAPGHWRIDFKNDHPDLIDKLLGYLPPMRQLLQQHKVNCKNTLSE